MATAAPAAVVFAWIDDLARYPEWLGLVSRAEPAPDADGDDGPAWSIDLRGRLGPLARAKRLRMVRTVHDRPGRVVFERRELDGRRHSPWVLRGEVTATPEGSHLEMALHYGGGLLGPVVERLLGDEIERSRPRLIALVEADA